MIPAAAPARGPAASGPAAAEWVVLLPLKQPHAAKTRLHVPPPVREALTRAMAADTTAAALAAGGPRGWPVVVVCSDPVVAATLPDGVLCWPDEGAGSLNHAVAAAASRARARWPGAGVAALTADLPALRPDALTAVVDRVRSGRAVVSDSSGVGTVLLAAAAGSDLAPSFEGASAARHRASGAGDLSRHAAAGLRRDVDTVADLHEALALGVGPATAAAAALTVAAEWSP